MREMAEERGVSILELSRRAESDDSIDHEIDARSGSLAEERDDFVIDSRLAWYFIPLSFKVFLDVSLDEATRRIFGDNRGGERENIDYEATRRAIEARTESEAARYEAYYGIDYRDTGHYDLVIDTSSLSADEVIDRIVAAAS